MIQTAGLYVVSQSSPWAGLGVLIGFALGLMWVGFRALFPPKPKPPESSPFIDGPYITDREMGDALEKTYADFAKRAHK